MDKINFFIIRIAIALLLSLMVRVNINLLQWNARGLGAETKNKNIYNPNSKINNLNQLLHDLNFPDVVCIQEPLIKENHTLNFPNYNHEVIYKSRGCRGLLTLIKNTHTFKVLQQQSNRFITTHTLEIHIHNQTKIHITNYYRHWQNRNNDLRNVNNLENLIGSPLKNNLTDHLIIGDFNSHSSLWGSRTNSKTGKIIAKIIEEEQLTIHNTGEATRIGQRLNESDSSIDLTISENLENLRVTDWKVMTDTLGSDHLPIQTNCGTNVRNNFTPPHQIRFSTNKANWNQFQTETANYNWSACRDDDIEIYSKNIVDALTISAKKCMPHTNPESKKPIPKQAKKSVPWWDAECEEAKQQKINAQK